MVALLALILVYLARKPVPEHITYGMSFNAPYAIDGNQFYVRGEADTHTATRDERSVQCMGIDVPLPTMVPMAGPSVNATP